MCGDSHYSGFVSRLELAGVTLLRQRNVEKKVKVLFVVSGATEKWHAHVNGNRECTAMQTVRGKRMGNSLCCFCHQLIPSH
jgi:hypothetical protein